MHSTLILFLLQALIGSCTSFAISLEGTGGPTNRPRGLSTFALRMNRNADHQRSSTSASLAAPLYITIGPPCSGKTTWLRQESRRLVEDGGTNGEQMDQSADNGCIVDIALDDQLGIYLPIPTEDWLTLIEQKSQLPQSKIKAVYHEKFLWRTLLDRIRGREQLELSTVLQLLQQASKRQDDIASSQNTTLIIQRLQSTLRNELRAIHMPPQASPMDDENRTRGKKPKGPHPMVNEIIDLYSTAFGEVLNEKISGPSSQALRLPPTIDLYVMEAIFRPHQPNDVHSLLQAIGTQTHHVTSDQTIPAAASTASSSPTSGLDRANMHLQSVQSDQAVAVGNTNTKPSDYKTALQFAEKQGRPVIFVLSGALHQPQAIASTARTGNSTNSETVLSSMIVEYVDETAWDMQPLVDTKELMKRNLRRFLETGRYIPATVIWDMQSRYIQLMERVVEDYRRLHNNNKDGHGTDTSMNRTDVHRSLIKMIHFERFDDGTVRSFPPTGRGEKRPRQNNNKPIPTARNTPGAAVGTMQHGTNNADRHRPWDRNPRSDRWNNDGRSNHDEPRMRNLDATPPQRHEQEGSAAWPHGYGRSGERGHRGASSGRQMDMRGYYPKR